MVRRVVVVGGGITGLTTAYRLLQARRDARGAALEVTLLEERARLGGNIQTERPSGLVIDAGPDAFVTARPYATALCKELGLGDRLIGTNEKNRRVYVQRGGALERLPEGVMLAVPTELVPMAKSRLFSWSGKARMALDLVLPRRSADGDESVGHFIRRRLGSEALDQLAEPLLGGIYAGNVDTLSLRSTFPQLIDLEAKHGSLIRGALAQKAARAPSAGKPPPSPFHSLLGGMGELPDALARRIEELGGVIRLGARMEALEAPPPRRGDKDAPRLRVRLSGGEAVPADDVVVTTPAYVAADALDGLDRELAARLRQVPYVSTATVVLGFARPDVPHPLDAVGLILPKREGRRALAVTFVTSKWPGRAPDDTVLLRVFLGGHRDAGVLLGSDDELVQLARGEIEALLGVRARPLIARVFRYERANAQPVVGHAERIKRIRERAARHPGLHFAGAAFDGVGIPECVRQAGEAAATITQG